MAQGEEEGEAGSRKAGKRGSRTSSRSSSQSSNIRNSSSTSHRSTNNRATSITALVAAEAGSLHHRAQWLHATGLKGRAQAGRRSKRRWCTVGRSSRQVQVPRSRWLSVSGRC